VACKDDLCTKDNGNVKEMSQIAFTTFMDELKMSSSSDISPVAIQYLVHLTCSAKTGRGVSRVFATAIRLRLMMQQMRPSYDTPKYIKTPLDTPKRKCIIS
jgi:hypothetical protein